MTPVLRLCSPRLPRRLAAAAALTAVFALGGCSWLPFGKKETPAVACPAAAVLRPLANTAVFTKPDMAVVPTDVMFYGILSEIDAQCDVSAGTLHADLNVIIAAQRGPATQGNSVNLPYFIAVLSPDQTILTKKSFNVTVAIPQDAVRGGITDHIEEAIPLGGRSPGTLEIVAGFQQTPQVIDFYKHFRGR